jgi:putative Mg2+ transporter-C (MgtC) family protein
MRFTSSRLFFLCFILPADVTDSLSAAVFSVQTKPLASNRRPLSTRTVLWSPEVEQLDLSSAPQQYRRPGLPWMDSLGKKGGISQVHSELFEQRDSLSIVRSIRQWTRPTRWMPLLILAVLVSVAILVPVRSVHALETALAVPQNLGATAVTSAAAATAATGTASSSSAVAAAAAVVPPCWTTASPVSMMGQLRLTVRMVYAALLGAIVGQERCGSKDQRYSPAGGIRTMALVSLGAATFTLCSMYGFSVVGGASRYDPSRMAANVSSGVGFIGAGVITTTSSSNNKDHGPSSSCGSMVHGLTTAAAIWLSAAIGVGCGVGMCVLSTVTALLTIAVLRIGEQQQSVQDAKRQLTEQHAREQEDQLLWRRELRGRMEERTSSNRPSTTAVSSFRNSPAESPTSYSFQKEIEEFIKFQNNNSSNDPVVHSHRRPSDDI